MDPGMAQTAPAYQGEEMHIQQRKFVGNSRSGSMAPEEGQH